MANTRVKVDASKVVAAIAAHTRKYQKKATVEVSYSGVPYALFVHENLQAQHAPPTRAKFLEAPARYLKTQMAAKVTAALKNKKSLESGLVEAAVLLYDESQRLVPVEYGDLKASGKVVIA